MADTKKYKINRVVDANGTLEIVHPETDAEQVLYDGTIGSTTVTNVDEALGALNTLAQNSGVTGVKGNSETAYRTGQVNITPANIGLGNVNNTSDANKPVSTAQQTAINTAKSEAISETKEYVSTYYITKNVMGANNGVATLNADGKVPNSQLPSYVDDVLEYTNKSSFPSTGETGKIYVAQDTNITYRWSGSAYVEISSSLALGETSSTAYAGDKGKANADAITSLTSRVGALETADDQNVKLTGAQQIAGEKVFTDDVTIKSGNGLCIGNSSDEFAKLTNDEGSEGTFCFPVNGSGTLATQSDIPTKVSELTNDSGFTTNKGTVTSVTITAGTGIAVSSSSAITTSGSRTISLANSGVTAGSYSAVNVDAKGRVTAGGTSVEFGTSGQTEPSDSLMVGGLFFQMV